MQQLAAGRIHLCATALGGPVSWGSDSVSLGSHSIHGVSDSVYEDNDCISLGSASVYGACDSIYERSARIVGVRVLTARMLLPGVWPSAASGRAWTR